MVRRDYGVSSNSLSNCGDLRCSPYARHRSSALPVDDINIHQTNLSVAEWSRACQTQSMYRRARCIMGRRRDWSLLHPRLDSSSYWRLVTPN